MSPTLYRTLPGESGVGVTFPARTAANAKTSLVSIAGDATGILCAPKTTLTSGARALRRRMEAAYAFEIGLRPEKPDRRRIVGVAGEQQSIGAIDQ